MRKNYIVSLLALVGLATTLYACGNKKADSHTPVSGHSEENIDNSLLALAQPVNEQVLASMPTIKAQNGARIFSATLQGVMTYDTRNETSIASRIAGRIEKLYIKYNYQPIRKGALIMEVYSPDLVAAQRELLMVRNETSLFERARQRLQLLGMQDAQVNQVLKTGNVLYRVPVYSMADGYILEKGNTPGAAATPMTPAPTAESSGMSEMGGGSTPSATPTPVSPSSSPVLIREGQYVNAGQSLFTIYKATNLVAEFSFPASLASNVKKGDQLLFNAAGTQNALMAGVIGLIEPVYQSGQNFMKARVYLNNTGWQIGQLLTGHLPVVYRDGWWLPKEAVLKSGIRRMVFRFEKGFYIPVAVETGAEIENMIQVKTDISTWQLAANASYLVDSESFIKPGK